MVAGARDGLTAAVDELLADSRTEQRTSDVDTVAAEVLPLAEALAFIGSRGPRVLRPRRWGARGRPLWLWGVRSRVERVPHGTVLVLGAWNYPLLLGGVQVAQALAAGNVVQWKPAPGSEAVCRRFAACLLAAGVPRHALTVLDSDVSAATAALDRGVDLVVLTGSAATGRAVLRRAAETLTPAIMELSGCDAAIVLRSASLERAAAAVRFALTINSGATCIGPRRLILDQPIATDFLQQLESQIDPRSHYIVHPAARQAVIDLVRDTLQRGGTDRLGTGNLERLEKTGEMAPLLLDNISADWPIASADLFAPITTIQRVSGLEQAATCCNASRYGLAASIFGSPSEAARLAAALRVGNVTINDIIVPTADPRLPFGGRGDSGFGVTRGVEGLYQMTAVKVTSSKHGSAAPHLAPHDPGTLDTLLGALQMNHAGRLADRWRGLKRIIRGVQASRKHHQAKD